MVERTLKNNWFSPISVFKFTIETNICFQNTGSPNIHGNLEFFFQENAAENKPGKTRKKSLENLRLKLKHFFSKQRC